LLLLLWQDLLLLLLVPLQRGLLPLVLLRQDLLTFPPPRQALLLLLLLQGLARQEEQVQVSCIHQICMMLDQQQRTCRHQAQELSNTTSTMAQPGRQQTVPAGPSSLLKGIKTLSRRSRVRFLPQEYTIKVA
jgi:hypothetical protein